MVLVTVMYPGGAGTKFDQDYYLKTHMPLVEAHWSSKGLEKMQVVRAAATPDGSPPTFSIMALLTFRSAADFKTAATEHGAAVFADIVNFTDQSPVVQINDVLL